MPAYLIKLKLKAF